MKWIKIAIFKLFSTIKVVYIINLNRFQDNARFPDAESVSEKGYARNRNFKYHKTQFLTLYYFEKADIFCF